MIIFRIVDMISFHQRNQRLEPQTGTGSSGTVLREEGEAGWTARK